MFASRTPRDLNHDRFPYVDKEDGPGREIRQAHPDAWTEREPRPEYDHVQHNGPNTILVAFRERGDADYPDEWFSAVIALQTFGGYPEWDDERSYFHPLITATAAEAKHALRVLRRLYDLKEETR